MPNKLTAKGIAALKDYGLYGDGDGLYLQITQKGSRSWLFKYSHAGKRRAMGLGPFSLVSLAEARGKALACRKILLDGADPLEQWQAEKPKKEEPQNTFAMIADEVRAKKVTEKKSGPTLDRLDRLHLIAKRAFPDRSITSIRAPEILTELRKLEGQGHLETAARLRASISEVFRYAIATGRAETDPTPGLKGAIASPVVTHQPSIIEPKAFGGLLRAIDGYQGEITTKIALKLLALTFVRPGELRKAEWTEFDFDRKIWTVTADHTKKRRAHLVPLSTQALALLRELKLHTSGKQFLFPAMGNEARPMSENTMNAALHRMGFMGEMVSHGFRASADSMLSESGDWSRDAIDRQMQHVEANKVKRAYNRSEFLPERTRLMQSWADMLDVMRALPAQ